MGFGDGSLRALTLVDVLAQLNSDSGQEIAFNPDEVINALTADAETLKLTTETFATSTVTNYPVNLIQDVGPVGYWRLDDPVASTVIYDSSPWNTTTYPKVPGTVVGGVTFQATGAMTGSKGATLNGTTGYLQIANGASLQRVGDLSIELWLKTTSLAAAQVLVSKGTTGEYHLVLNTNGSVSLLMGPSYSTVVIPAATISTGTWYHLVVTRRAVDKSIAAYLNGTSRYTGTYSTAPSTTTNVLRLGATSPTAGAFFVGTLDEVVLYARPLTSTQVAAHYAWSQAADCGSTPYGVGQYGYANYPLPGSAGGALYGDATTVYGGVTYS
jgi:type II secretory pathway pseudopilin PulG